MLLSWLLPSPALPRIAAAEARETPQIGDGELREDKGHKKPPGTEEH